MAQSEQRFFFLHPMRTGGTTFVWHLNANLGPQNVYPNNTDYPVRSAVEQYPLPDENPDYHVPATSVSYLMDQSDRFGQLRAITGHFPFFVIELLPYRYNTITILRDPVSRVVSALRQWQLSPGRLQGAPLEAFLDDPEFGPHHRNHVTKLYGLTADSGADHYAAIDVDMDDAWLTRAKSNLETIDMIGFTDDHEGFVTAVVERYGWRRVNVPPQNVTSDEPVAPALLRRIADENAADIELHQFARRVVARR